MARRLVRGLVALYPPDFRRRFGADMLAAFDREWARAVDARTRWGRFTWYTRTLAETAAGVAWEWLATIPSKGSRTGRGTMRGWGTDALQDLRWAGRRLGRQKMFATTMSLNLALGLGAAAAIFSVVDAVMLRPLPYEAPDRLATVGLALEGRNGVVVPFLTSDQIGVWTESADFFSETAYSERVRLTRTDAKEPELLQLLATSPELDDVLGIAPVRGRAFGPEDARPGSGRSILLSHGYWTRMGSPHVVGRNIQLEEESWTVLGVLPRGFKYPVGGRVDGWIPLASDWTAGGQPVSRAQVVGRLRDGVDVETAQARASEMGLALQEDRPTRMGWSARLSLVTAWRGNDDARKGLWLLAGAVGFMLLIGLANAGALLVARSSRLWTELSVQRAVGASGGRVLRHMMVESALLAAMAGALALAVAWALVEGLRRAMPSELDWSSVHELGIGTRGLAFVAVLVFAFGVVVGLPAALHAVRRSSPDRSAGSLRRSPRLRLLNGLVLAEVALSVVLLAGSALFSASFTRMVGVDPGIDTESLAFVEMAISPRVYPTGADRRQLLDRLDDRLSRIPGVESVAIADGVPPNGGGLAFGTFEGEGEAPLEGFNMVAYAMVDPDYFQTLGIEVAEGRSLVAGDEEVGAAVIDRDLARALFGSASPLGRRFRQAEDAEWKTVVGIVDDLKMGGLDDRTTSYAALYPASRSELPGYAALTVRAAGDPKQLLPAIRRAIAEIAPVQPVSSVTTARQALSDSIDGPRFLAVVMATLSFIALALAGVGVYGLASYVVTQRRREIAIRVAVGATSERIQGAVIRTGALLSVAGALLGLALALVLSRLAADLLYGVDPRDPATLALAAGGMVLTALLASLVPARRATRVDPVEVLKTEG